MRGPTSNRREKERRREKRSGRDGEGKPS